MSISKSIQFECPECSTTSDMVVWRSINTKISPEAKEELIQGKTNLFHCARCGVSERVSVPLMYHDPQNEFCIQFFPFGMIRDDDFFHEFAEDGQMDAVSHLPKKHVAAYFKNIHVVFSMDELSRYVVFRESLARHRGGSPSLASWSCFSCGRTIQPGELACSVSRFHQVRGEADQEGDEILDAVASLQVCADCMARAATEDIQLPDQPLPLLELEKKGLNQFARQVADNMAELKTVAKGRDKCSLCGATIAVGDTYRRLQVAVESSDAECIQEIEAQTLGILCEKCSEDFLILL